ncbi:MAG: Rne/Rng family ribonuclease [Bacteroidales bacterium]|jgi:ribonuclease G|nr:Rne/Rng family ribonuclease [Bacteroidales bacterium]
MDNTTTVPTVNRELVISSDVSEVNIVLLEDKQLVEFHKEQSNSNFAVGDVYYGRIKKILPGLNAAFVDIGSQKDAFLHFLDLGPQINSLIEYSKLAHEGKTAQTNISKFKLSPDADKSGKISDYLQAGDQIPVQIAKEPINTKGPRISAEISFAGRYIVLVPFANRISVSQKIRSGEERNRLRKLIQSIKPNNFGVIIRTVAEGKKVEDLDADMKYLLGKWEQMTESLYGSKAPTKLVSELDRTSAMLRDLLNESFNAITVDNQALYDEVKSYISTIAPQKSDIVKLYKGKEPIFEHYGVARQIKGLFGRIVTIRNGVYLIIEHTEAMHVIDVNSGHRLNKENSQEENALAVNLESAVEIARQLRLRDMGGIIIVDFIDMHEAKHRKELFEKLQEEMAKDRAKHTVLPATKFGLIQITRQRVRPETEVTVQEKCPVCDGKGKIRPSMIYIDEIEGNLKYLLLDQNEKEVTIQVHPFVYAYLTKGLFSIRRKWMWKYHKKIHIQEVKSFHILQSCFLNKNGDEITF